MVPKHAQVSFAQLRQPERRQGESSLRMLGLVLLREQARLCSVKIATGKEIHALEGMPNQVSIV